MSYLSEFRLNWTNLLGAGLGLAFGSAFNHYMMNLFGPALMAEFHWSKSDYAGVGMIGIVALFLTPVADRTMTFTRVVVGRFDKARGVALACLLSCPPIVGGIGALVEGRRQFQPVPADQRSGDTAGDTVLLPHRQHGRAA